MRTLRFCCAFYFEPREKREREPTGKVRHQMRDILMVGDCATTTANFGFNFQQIQPAAAEGAAMQ